MKRTSVFYLIFILVTATGPVTEGYAKQKPVAFLPERTYEFPAVAEGTEVVHDFILHNKGQAPLVIKKLKSG